MKDFDLSRDIRCRVRGAPRKSRDMVARIGEIAGEFPIKLDEESNQGNWHTHLPVGCAFINSRRAPAWVRRLCVQALLEAAERIRAVQRAHDIPCRVVVMGSLPGLWSSQIIVFFGSEYYSTFFDRNTPEQTWTLKAPRRSLAREWGLRLPKGFLERGYAEANLGDNGRIYRSDLWFFGDLD